MFTVCMYFVELQKKHLYYTRRLGLNNTTLTVQVRIAVYNLDLRDEQALFET